MQNLQITARGLELTDSIKSYVTKKISKVSKLVNKNISVHCEIISVKKKIGLSDSIVVELSVKLPKAFIKVEKSGGNFYEVVDEIEEILKKQVKKYKGKQVHKKIKFSEAILNY